MDPQELASPLEVLDRDSALAGAHLVTEEGWHKISFPKRTTRPCYCTPALACRKPLGRVLREVIVNGWPRTLRAGLLEGSQEDIQDDAFLGVWIIDPCRHPRPSALARTGADDAFAIRAEGHAGYRGGVPRLSLRIFLLVSRSSSC